MKYILSVLLATSVVLAADGLRAQGTTPLYISKQTNQTLKFEGSYSKTTDSFENGTMSISVDGPIQYQITPSTLSIGIKESKTWNGEIWGDPASAPEPGSAANATMTGNYSISYSRPVPGNPTQHEIVNEHSSSKLEFVVNSIKVDAPDTVKCCPDASKVVAATGYPSGGKYSWAVSGNVSITGPADQEQVELKTNPGAGTGTAVVTYSFGNVTYVKSVFIKADPPKVELPELIEAAIDKKIQISPKITPSGSVKWSVSSGLQLNSGPYNYVAFITCKQGGNQTVTAEVKACGQTIVKEITVKVNPCQVTVPDTVTVLKGKTVSIAASASMEGTYSWAAGGQVSVEGAANGQTVTIKGNNNGSGTATVTFQGTGCEDTKTTVVKVVEDPTVTITPQWSTTPFGANASITICKNERRLMVAKGLPEGGTYSWAVTGPLRAYGAANNYVFVFEATGGGDGSATVTYTKDGKTATASVSVKVLEISRIDITASNNNQEIPKNTAVTYTAKVLDHAGADITNQITLHWKVVYIPVGQNGNVGNWVSYDLQGGGNTQTHTWGFPQGNHPLPGNPPHKMDAWIEASEYCTYKSGSIHLKVVQ